MQRNTWWGLLAIASVITVAGLVDLARGVTWQAVDVTGSTSAAIATQSGAGLELADFGIRTGGLYLIAFGVLLGAVLLFAYRLDHAWAWWAMWTMPVFVIANSLLLLSFGAWGPAITGTLVGLAAVLILLVGAPRFFGRSERHYRAR